MLESIFKKSNQEILRAHELFFFTGTKRGAILWFISQQKPELNILIKKKVVGNDNNETDSDESKKNIFNNSHRL